MMTAKHMLVIGGVSLVVGGATFVLVRAGMRDRCRKRVRSAVRKLPLVTDAWKRQQEQKICVGEGATAAIARPSSGNHRTTSSSLASKASARGMRQRAGAAPSQRDRVAGTIVGSDDLLQQAFDAGAENLWLHRYRDRYTATMSAMQDEYDDGSGKSVTRHARVEGKGRSAEAALRSALGKLTRAEAVAAAEQAAIARRSAVR